MQCKVSVDLGNSKCWLSSRADMVCFVLRFWDYVKYFIDFNTKRGICSASAVLNL